MGPQDLASGVAIGAGAALIVAVAFRHLLGRPHGFSGFALGLLGALLLGFPLFERFEIGLGADGGTLSADLRTRIDLAATEAVIVARVDDLDARVDDLAAILDPAPIIVPDPEGATPDEGGDGTDGGDVPPPVVVTAPPPPGAGLLALVFHRAARAADAERLVQDLRALGFAAAPVATDLSEARDAPPGSARVLWQPSVRAVRAEPSVSDPRLAAEAAADALRDLGAGDVRLDDAPAQLQRGDVQIQLF